MKAAIYGLLITIMALTSIPLHAEDEEAEGASSSDVIYVDLKPSFVANYQAAKIRYLKADVTLKVAGSATAEAIGRHKPSIRHNLVMLFSRQTEDEMSTLEGKQQLKEDALKEVITALEMENEPTNVKEILFTSFILD